MARLDSCEPALKSLMNEVIKHVDITVLEGHRTVDRQAELFSQGKSKLDGSPGKMSKHNYSPSRAVDVAPWPIDWQDRERFIACAYYNNGEQPPASHKDMLRRRRGKRGVVGEVYR